MAENMREKYLFGNVNKSIYTAISLFAGAGGMDMGFENQGFKIIWANDIDKDACETHSSWSDAIVEHGNISKINFDEIPAADVILGGFPCQGFSLAGPRKIDDNRNALYRHFVKLVELKKPLAFVAENVKGILTLGNGKIIDAIISDFRSKGYIVNKPHLVNAADYGVSQDRHRVVLIGLREDLGLSFSGLKPVKEKVTLKEALKDVPPPKKGDVCDAPYSSRYMSRNRRRGWDEVSYTIPAMAKQVPLHPSSPKMKKIGKDLWEFGKGTTRRFSWQEVAAIQTFPPGMEFAGDLISKYKQIGNAVPVKLAEAFASSLYKTLNQRLSATESNLLAVNE